MKNFFGCKMVHKKFKLKKKISHKQKNCCCCCTCQHISPFEFWQVPNKSKIKEVKSLPRSTVFQNLYTRCFKNSFYFKIKSSKNSKHYLLTRLSRAVQKNKISLITKKQKKSVSRHIITVRMDPLLVKLKRRSLLLGEVGRAIPALPVVLEQTQSPGIFLPLQTKRGRLRNWSCGWRTGWQLGSNRICICIVNIL